MKSKTYKEDESAYSVAQRLLHRKKFTQEVFGNKTAQERRLNNFHDTQSEGRVQSGIQEGKKSRKKQNQKRRIKKITSSGIF